MRSSEWLAVINTVRLHLQIRSLQVHPREHTLMSRVKSLKAIIHLLSPCFAWMKKSDERLDHDASLISICKSKRSTSCQQNPLLGGPFDLPITRKHSGMELIPHLLILRRFAKLLESCTVHVYLTEGKGNNNEPRLRRDL